MDWVHNRPIAIEFSFVTGTLGVLPAVGVAF